MALLTSERQASKNPISTFSVIFTLCALAPAASFAQSVSLTPPPLSEYTALISDWQKKKDLLNGAIAAQRDYETSVNALALATAEQQAKTDSAKAGLNAAVLKVAEAKNRLSKVDTNDTDPKGEALAQTLLETQSDLNTAISASEQLQKDISALSSEHERLGSTAKGLKNAAAAAKAAHSAAQVLVEAVKSAQEVIASNNSENGGGETDLESDFFKDALKQAENARQYEQDAQNALEATRTRQTQVAERLLKAEEQLEYAKQAEAGAYKKFAAADEDYKKHQAKRQVEKDARDALIAEITTEMNAAQEDLEAQQKILQNESLAMQEIAANQTSAANRMADLHTEVDRAKSAFEGAQSILRAQQRQRAIQTAAILADLNAEMRSALRNSAPGADTSTFSERLIIPAAVLFSDDSAKIQKSEAVRLNELAAILKDTVSRVPEGLDWMIRVDNYTTDTETAKDSWTKSHSRAVSVAKSLISTGKLDTSRVSANGMVNAAALSDFTSNGWVEIVLTAR
nr:OmpA family protein [Amylibacter sp.]